MGRVRIQYRKGSGDHSIRNHDDRKRPYKPRGDSAEDVLERMRTRDAKQLKRHRI